MGTAMTILLLILGLLATFISHRAGWYKGWQDGYKDGYNHAEFNANQPKGEQ